MNDVIEPEVMSPIPTTLPSFITREQLAEVEARMRAEAMKEGSGFMVGDAFPLTHTFADGLYIREIRVPAGNYVVTKLFKQEHATFLMQGECIILTETGRTHVSAPSSWITPIGTKRLIYVVEDCVWTTIHSNSSNEKDIDKLESLIIAENYDQLESLQKKEDLCIEAQ